MTTTRTQRALFLGLSAAAVATTLSVAAPPVTAASPDPGPLSWRPCAGAAGPAGQECAELSVPLDYRRPQGRQLTIAVSRLRSDQPSERRGTLLMIPGGPGGSGVARIAQQGERVRTATGGAYDLVSLDPRGVGGSSRASCGLEADDRSLSSLRSWPGADGSIDENLARSRRTAAACDRDGGEVLRSLSTANEARDIDRLRAALGEERLSVWGTSYGTYVGAVYAQEYPRRTDRVVLDSNGDPDPARVARGWLANMARGAADRFPDFAAWAADPARGRERIAEHPADVEPLFLSLAARLDRSPKESTTPGTPLTGNGLRQALQSALYDDDLFASFGKLLRQAQDPALTPELPPELAQALPQEDAAVSIGVICNDVRWPADVPAYRAQVARDRARYPLTAGMPANITPCSFWKNPPAEEPVRVNAHGPSNILMIQNLRDPATPYAGALRMRAALGARARLVSVDSGGHGAYLNNGNACGDRTVTEFLTTGRRPSGDVRCPA